MHENNKSLMLQQLNCNFKPYKAHLVAWREDIPWVRCHNQEGSAPCHLTMGFASMTTLLWHLTMGFPLPSSASLPLQNTLSLLFIYLPSGERSKSKSGIWEEERRRGREDFPSFYVCHLCWHSDWQLLCLKRLGTMFVSWRMLHLKWSLCFVIAF